MSASTRFAMDPAYQAALEAAARSSVLSATSDLAALALPPTGPGVLLHTPPPPPPPRHTRGVASDATPPPPPPPQPPPPPPPPPAAATAAAAAARPSGGGSSTTKPPAAVVAAAESAAKGGADKRGAIGRRSSSPARTQARCTSAERRAAAAAAAAAATPGAAAVAPSGQQQQQQRGGRAGAREAGWEAAPARFAEYRRPEELQAGFKTGQLLKGRLRVNAGNRLEGYVSVPGLPHDVHVRGEANQNRSLEGDEVALEVLPVSGWWAAPGRQQQAAAAAAAPAPAPADAEQLRLLLLGDEAPWRDVGGAAAPGAAAELVARIAAHRPDLRITAKVVAILSPSPKREHVVGLLQLWAPYDASAAATSSTNSTTTTTSAAATTATSASAAGVLPDLPSCYLLPLDPRLPRCVVRPADLRSLPPALLDELRAAAGAPALTLMSARIAEWTAAHSSPAVALRASLGQAGEIETETAALLEMEAIRHGPWEADVLACLPPTPWAISEQERAARRDFRPQRVFSIDPPTAKDLDDALSIHPHPLPDGSPGWRVGVHIADVAHFIPPFSALDIEAGKRATSTYLVQRVIPMLPPLLCEQLCSLNPGVERLAFSVVWDMDGDGKIHSTWFGRSVIRSCAKLAYPMVQAMIEGRFDPDACPAQLQGEGVTWDQVVSDSLALWAIASRLRAARYANGALRLDGVRLCFALDADGNPVSTAPYVQKEANQLVEEFMLLANMSVANCIADTFPERALLRRHPPPNANKLRALSEAAAAAGLPIDVSSAAAIQEGLAALRAMRPGAHADAPAAADAAGGGGGGGAGAAGGAADDADGAAAAEGQAEATGSGSGSGGADGGVGGLLAPGPAGRHRRLVELITMLATRPMQLAEYYCTGLVDHAAAWRHYALAVPAYTHFTSPIRRYPDVVVHRLLAAALDARARAGAGAGAEGGGGGGGDVAAEAEAAAARYRLLDTRLTGLVAEHCNDRRLAARNAQDGSLRLYLCVLLKRHPVVTLGTVSNAGGDSWFNVYLPEFGHDVCIHVADTGVAVRPAWNPGAKVLTLARGEANAGGGGGGGDGGGEGGNGGRRPGQGAGGRSLGRSRRGGGPGGRGGNGRGGGGGGGFGGGGGGGGGVPLAEWVAGLPPVSNRYGVRPVSLPLHVQLFADVPVILTAITTPGQPSQLYARVYLSDVEAEVEERAAAGAAAAAAAQAKAKAALTVEGSTVMAAAVAQAVAAATAAAAAGEGVVEGPPVRESEISWEATLND